MTREAAPSGPDGERGARLTQDDHARAMLNILEDFHEERLELADAQRAMLNILEDFTEEKARLERTERAMMNLLEDFDAEREKVSAASRELARSNADLEQFAHVVSHDLQEPLRMVSSYAQRLTGCYDARVDPRAEKYLCYTLEGARRAEAMVRGILEYARVSRREMVLETVSAEEALRQALANLERTIHEAGAVVTHGPLPEVRADVVQLARVFQNLVGNAIKYRRAEQPAVVRVTGERHGDQCDFAVEDNGIGIDPKHFDRIFTLFERVGEAVKSPGMGLGLPITRKLIERHGGRVWLESVPGRGTTFRFTLPAPPGS